MRKKITVAICGFGNRGAEAYGSYQMLHPDEMEIVAVADPRPARRALAVKEYGVPEDRCFTSGEAMLAQEKLADVMFITTQDSDHIRFAIPALEKGYHLLLEKPISPSLDECVALREKAHETGRIVVVCHVLRYTQFYQKLKELLVCGAIGKLESVVATENVAYWHFAHSYVRGNWRRADESSPVILAKSCHDMDILRYLVGKPCLRVSSFGDLDWFRAINAPLGSAARCLDCQVKADCPYDAEKIYLTNPASGYFGGHRQWPLTVLTNDVTEEGIRKALQVGPYGRCVYRCDNDVADHQTVNLEFEGGVTAVFNLSAFTEGCYRTIRLMGSLGELEGNLDEQKVTLRPFGGPEKVFTLDPVEGEYAGHGGGDARMMEQLCLLISEGGRDALTSIDVSVESHLMAMAAEESRLHGGKPIDLAEFGKARK